MVEKVIKGVGDSIKTALSRTPLPEYEYHSLGFDVLVELIKFSFDNSYIVEPTTINSYIDSLNDLLGLEEMIIVHDLEELYWDKLVKIIDDDPS